MKRNVSKKIFDLLKSKGILAISSSMLLVSCGVQTSYYTEMDGIYYDPEKDVIEEYAYQQPNHNQVGSDYDYNGAEESAYEKTKKHGRYGSGRYIQRNDDFAVSSDWGTYTGTETNYSSWGNWGGFYSPFGWNRFGLGLGFGYGWGSYFSMNYGWGSPWYGYGWGSPFSYYRSFYNPFWGGFGGYYHPYYGGYGYPYYGGYGYSVTPRNYRRSGVDASPFRSGNSVSPVPNTANRGGFRNSAGRGTYQQNNGFGSSSQNGGFRNAPTQRRYESNSSSRSYDNSNSAWRNNSGGFNNSSSGGFRNSSSSGGFGGGATRSGSSGGFRSGGFR